MTLVKDNIRHKFKNNAEHRRAKFKKPNPELKMNKRVEIRSVWQQNLESEFALIEAAIAHYPFVSFDTEFPGTILECKAWDPPAYQYQIMKGNVDAMNIIQLGLTLSDHSGNLPDLGTDCCCIWEFNFRDFDIERGDHHSADAIEFLKRHGIDFLQNKKKGIYSSNFAWLMERMVLHNRSRLTWVTFHGSYDFGYLMKILTQKDLPTDIGGFMGEVEKKFGKRVYDIKHLIKCQGLYGGLEKVARLLQVGRVAGKSHQAGSDSLLTLQTFMRLKDVHFGSFLKNKDNCSLSLNQFRGVLHGLELEAH
ncbi:PREDICTED: probable CCR4-associated factor [Prunus dulcis]|uniref:poly(A)-specific ribonuclease n=1 Tax=Prunus dulcis TaxID=3755 RepID=A0A5E4FY15_PRUDU|nr:probable CCR4-associated factor 1 homolog 11 [Prunus dulcis]VVA32292.1 PREDICTED: probable CCR4-associated factor [Prunus dulcis]